MYTMSLQKPRPLDTLNQVMTAFKQFEKKLDKLQDDVNYHGQTLTDLRIMVANLTAPADVRMTQDGKTEIPKRPSRKTTAIQYEFDEPLKVKRKTAIQPLPSKIKAKSFQGPKYGLRMSGIDAPFMNKMPSSPKTTKHSVRLSKADAPRKATTLRSQKAKVEKRRSKPKK
ncbi:uncharacterized protein LOC114359043 [Ostrinia furnacalis]|uniref:uncharacterized protein LOC114359043 n=1 Tax=Ostrinia furnacalis TaxID=93504 RepID=UPI0010396E1D|nr:uncharacterized protein LOC114359043 [Ostrinia furnacalis]